LAFHTSLGPRGAFIAVVVSDSLLALLGVLWFRRGTWKRTVI
jgi:Na+-driven multidrug efflux pump